MPARPAFRPVAPAIKNHEVILFAGFSCDLQRNRVAYYSKGGDKLQLEIACRTLPYEMFPGGDLSDDFSIIRDFH